MIRRLGAVTAMFIGLAGCATSQGYEAVRSVGEAKAQCELKLTPAAQQACEAQYEMDYQEYRERRREAVGGATSGPGSVNGDPD